jgi:hypothetical protein
MNEVDNFLKRFHVSSNIDDTFTTGCCYWFAFVLYVRFLSKGSILMYDEIANHFGTKIDGIVYDITGNVSDKYKWKDWNSITDEALLSRIRRDCIMF